MRKSWSRNHGSTLVGVVELLEGGSGADGLLDRVQAAVVGHPHLLEQGVLAGDRTGPDELRALSSPATAAPSCSASGKERPMAIASPTDFMWVVAGLVGPGELLEREARESSPPRSRATARRRPGSPW